MLKVLDLYHTSLLLASLNLQFLLKFFGKFKSAGVVSQLFGYKLDTPNFLDNLVLAVGYSLVGQVPSRVSSFTFAA